MPKKVKFDKAKLAKVELKKEREVEPKVEDKPKNIDSHSLESLKNFEEKDSH